MKLVAVMSLDSNREELHRMYREHSIQVFSEIDIRGYHHTQTPSAVDVGWFGHASHPAYSTLTWAFLPSDQAEHLLDAIAELNHETDPKHPVRAFEMPVDRSI
ncbi:hypothetical protein CRI94_04600 [Longibacter salinarum]|uniref:Uncharacterized protein n=1 Tax=Longibacter salinarum TaxID=1850348 RepID=A0A2A8D039_9BACT|nr:hypothetical protein [Longibacter salinarum]PEN14322.1 hypothetical protein CRI94_04600 [Longibacter salinarum]